MRSPATHFFIALAVAFGAVAIYGGWFFAISQKSNDVASLQDQIVTEGKNINRIASARAALTEIAGDEAKVRSYFVPESGVVAFITDLQSRGTAQKAAVNVLSVATGGSATNPTLVLVLTVAGTFDAVMRTVGAIEYAPYDAYVSTFSVQQNPKGGWQANMTLTVGSVSAQTATTTP